LQLDGTAKFNQTNYDDAVSNGLQEILSKGIYFSTSGSSTDGLDSYITSQSGGSGALTSIISYEQENIWSLQEQQDQMQTRLDSKQSQLINQYSALNTLLYNLSSTSSALTSALDALNNKNN